MICCISALIAQAQDATQATKDHLVFSATPDGKGIIYKIDDKIVSDPLRGFGTAIEKYGSGLPVICLIDNRLPVRTIGEAVATAGKAGFKNIRSFAVDHQSGKVAEIKFGPWTSKPN